MSFFNIIVSQLIMESEFIALHKIVPKDLTFFIGQGKKQTKQEHTLYYTAIQCLFILLVHLPRKKGK